MKLVTLLLALVVVTTANRAAFAAMYYVTSTGAGAQDGSSWGDAFGNLQDAIDVSDSGDVIYLQSGVYTAAQPDAAEPSQYLVSSKANLTISGGYAGSGTPGNRDGGSTILQRDPASTRRIIKASGSGLTIDTITIDDGKLIVKGSQGAGLRLANCDVTITNCIIRNNSMTATNAASYYGGGIYASGGSLQIIDSTFSNNFTTASFDGSYGYGGAINANNTIVNIHSSLFTGNSLSSLYHDSHGGALYLNGGSANITQCSFMTNYLSKEATHSTTYAYGAAIYANNLSTITVSDSCFIGNYAIAPAGKGGTIYLTGASQRTLLQRCILRDNGQTGHSGNLHLDSGTLVATNLLVARTGVGDGINIASGNASFTFTTIADNADYGIRINNGAVTFSHSIFAGNGLGDYRRHDGTLGVEYTCAQEVISGSGNFVADPLFADTAHYHPRSRAGHYTGGFFSGGSWVPDPTDTSPTIDVAASAIAWHNEPQPNGHWANIGYDANTATASKSDLGEPPAATALAVYTYPPTNITDTAAWARGEVAHNGDAEDPDVYLVWGIEDKGTASTDAWLPNVRHLGTQPLWHLFAAQLTDLPPGTVFYRLYVTNSTGSAWSEPVTSFETAEMPEVNNLNVSHIARYTALINFDVAFANGRDAYVNLDYWVQHSAVTSTIAFGPCDGRVTSLLSDLTPGTNYGIRTTAVNGAGTAAKEIFFVTMSTNAAAAYVTPTGNGVVDGSSWGNAFSNLQDAITICGYPGDTIYMQSGTYTQTQPDINELSHYVVIDAPDLTISGGYAGSGTPGLRDDGITELKRDPATTRRILRASNSTLTLDHLTIKNGLLKTNGSQGAGLLLANCHTTLTNCHFIANSMVAAGSANYYGGAIYTAAGTLTATNCHFTGNFLKAPYDNSRTYGGAINANSTTTLLEGCTFEENYISTYFHDDHGGALYLSSGSATINSCHFYTNYIAMNPTHGTTYGYGGAIYANNVAPLAVTDSYFAGSYSIATAGNGGLFYFAGSSLRAVLNRCVLTDNCQLGNSGAIYLAGGTMVATNLLLVRTKISHALTVAGGSVSLVNTTIADNTGFGIRNQSGSTTLSHSILYGNTSGDMTIVVGNLAADYSLLQAPFSGTGNFVADPLFADTTHYHPRSRAGHYSGGFFNGGVWVTDPSDTSPSIDAAAPDTVWDNEPQPNGHWSNIGYDANTAVASKSDLGEPPAATALAVYTYPPTNITATAAWARGEVAHNGGAEDPDVYLVWGSTDHGTASTDAWLPNVRHLGTQPLWHLFASQLTDLTPGAVFYRLYVTNSTGSAWSEPAVTFETARLPEIDNLTITHISRHTAFIQFNPQYCDDAEADVTVAYWIDGDTVTNSIPLGPQESHVTVPIANLLLDTLYGVRVYGLNGAGIVSEETSFTTLNDVPIARYVTPTGAGIADGSSWANAYSNLQTAIDVCRYPHDIIYLKSGTYITIPANINDLSHYQIHGIGPLTISGGYSGDGAPGPRDNSLTILKRAAGGNRRLLDASGSTIVLDAIVLDDGKLTDSNAQGAGLRLVNCNATMTNCILRGNSMTSGLSGNFYGGAIHASGSTLAINNSSISNNFVKRTPDSSRTYGGAIWSIDSDLHITASTFANNYAHSPYHDVQGGAIGLSGGSAVVDHCTFLTNYLSMDAGHATTRAYGGAIYASGTSLFYLRDSYFAGNYEIGKAGFGGTLYFVGAAQKARIERCVFTRNGQDGHSGSIHLASGALAITNALVVRNGKDAGIHIAGGTATMSHITTANNKGWGINKTGGSATLSSSIAWGNTGGGISGCVTTYTCAQEVLAGDGNISVDPIFVDTTYYHLTSHGGHLVDGYFGGDTWKRIKLDSPCIDAGDPAAPFDNEIRPHGSRANMGAYGNTTAASITYRLGATVILLR